MLCNNDILIIQCWLNKYDPTNFKYNDHVRVLYKNFDAKYHLTILSHLAPIQYFMSLVIIFKREIERRNQWIDKVIICPYFFYIYV